jgi:hypothetical protein
LSYPQHLRNLQIPLPYFTFLIAIEFLHGTGRIHIINLFSKNIYENMTKKDAFGHQLYRVYCFASCPPVRDKKSIKTERITNDINIET